MWKTDSSHQRKHTKKDQIVTASDTSNTYMVYLEVNFNLLSLELKRYFRIYHLHP